MPPVSRIDSDQSRPSTVVAGIAPPDIARIAISGPGGHWKPPLSAHRAFLVLYAHGVRGSVRVIAYRRQGGSFTRTFSLPLSRRINRGPSHPHRRRGPVFDDEIGENILLRSYTTIVRDFGPPAAVHRAWRPPRLLPGGRAGHHRMAILFRGHRTHDQRQREPAPAFLTPTRSRWAGTGCGRRLTRPDAHDSRGRLDRNPGWQPLEPPRWPASGLLAPVRHPTLVHHERARANLPPFTPGSESGPPAIASASERK
jgi:hypothetical protein